MSFSIEVSTNPPALISVLLMITFSFEEPPPLPPLPLGAGQTPQSKEQVEQLSQGSQKSVSLSASIPQGSPEK